MSPDDLTVDYFVDIHGHDCYRICLPKGGPCSIVSSAHLIDERKTQLLRWNHLLHEPGP
jgi:hypothetical protein